MTFSINFSSGVLSFCFSVLDANHKAHTHTLCPNNTKNTFLFSAVLSEYTYIHIRKPKQTPTHTHPHACTPPKELPFTMFRHKLTDIPRCLSLLGHLLSLSLSLSLSLPFTIFLFQCFLIVRDNQQVRVDHETGRVLRMFRAECRLN